MNKKIIKRRIEAIRRHLNKAKAKCLIVTGPANVTYTTGFSGGDSWAVIAKGRVYLVTDGRYTEEAKVQCPACKIIQRTGPMTGEIAGLLKKLKAVRTAAIEKSATLAAFESLNRSVKARLKTVAGIIESVRSIKDRSEIGNIKAAARIAAKALGRTLRFVKQGMTENELAGMLDFQMRRLDAAPAFQTIVAFGPNASRPHHQPGASKLRKNDTILIDFGAKYKDYCCDLTKCFIIGRPNVFYKKVYDVVKEAQTSAIKMVKAGVEIKKVDAAAKEVIKKHDLPLYGHGTGHGLGLEVHEWPTVSGKSKGKLKAGQVITIEPGIYIPGKLGIRIEDDVLVTKTGCIILR